MSSLDSLLKWLRPPLCPSEVPIKGSWQTAEASLGMAFPEDYKEFISQFGTGAIDTFLWVLNPFSTNIHLNFFKEGKVRLENLRELHYETLPYPVFPDHNGIIPWGVTDNGDVLYWQCFGPSSSWPVVANESRGPRWRQYELSTSRFLEKLIMRELVVDIFPEDFPSEFPEFVQVT